MVGRSTPAPRAPLTSLTWASLQAASSETKLKAPRTHQPNQTGTYSRQQKKQSQEKRNLDQSVARPGAVRCCGSEEGGRRLCLL